jgi:hypothetical protein
MCKRIVYRGAEAPDIQKLALLYLNMTSSTADVERVFSYMKILKTARRSRLGQPLLNVLLRLNCNIPEFVNMTTLENYAVEWWVLKKRRSYHTMRKEEEEIDTILNKAEIRNEKRRKKIFEDLPSEDESEESENKDEESDVEEIMDVTEDDNDDTEEENEVGETDTETEDEDEEARLAGRSFSRAITIKEESEK